MTETTPTPRTDSPVFRGELETLINRQSMEAGANTPDFILADYLADCLAAFDRAVNAREAWYGRPYKGPGSEIADTAPAGMAPGEG